MLSPRCSPTLCCALPLLLATGACLPTTGDDDDDDVVASDAGSAQDAGGSGIGEWLRNAPPADPPTLLAPDPGEEGLWAAARLSPPAYPFDISLVNYTVGDGAAGEVMCSGTLAHQLALYVSSSTTPPENEAPTLSISVFELDPTLIGHMGRAVSEAIDPPLRLEQGEHLFVAVQLVGVHPDVLCVHVNDDDAYEGDRSYWSGNTAAPYGWVRLDSLGLPGSLLYTAYGHHSP